MVSGASNIIETDCDKPGRSSDRNWGFDKAISMDNMQAIDPILLSRLQLCGRYGKKGVLRVASADGKAGADLYFDGGVLIRLDFNDVAWLPLEENIEDKLFSMLRWRQPVASWYEGEACEEPLCRISLNHMLSLVADKGLDQRAEEWDLKTCELYSHKLVPILPLEIIAENEGVEIGRFRMESEDVVIGRNLEVDVALDEPSVSRHHAFLRCSGGGLSVTDLHSSNGTCLNGVELEPLVETRFKIHDELLLGRIRIRLQNAEPMTVAAYKLLAERQLRRRIQKVDPQSTDLWVAPTKLLPRISIADVAGDI